MKIAIIGYVPYPHGTGITQYNLSLALGLLTNGHEVECLTPFSFDSNPDSLNQEVAGSYKGINFRYLTGTSICPYAPSKYRNLKMLMIYIRSMIKLWRYLSKNSFDGLLFTRDISLTLPLKLYSMFHNIPCVEMCFEYPDYVCKNDSHGGIKGCLERVSYRLPNGMLVISDKLKQYYQPYTSSKCRFLVSPLMVDVSTDITATEPAAPPYILYSGDMSGTKDNVMDLIDAFAMISSDYPELRLKLTGNASNTEWDQIRQKLIKMELHEKVDLCGFVSNEKLEQLMSKASILTLCKTRNKQNEGNFPSKLGVYLKTGIPVVVSDVGSIGLYFKNGEHLFTVPPGNRNFFAEKLRYIFSFPDESRKVAKQGQKRIFEEFSMVAQAKKIVALFAELKEKS